MKKSALLSVLLVVLVLGAFANDPGSGNITVIMNGFRDDKGRAQIVLFNSEKGFPLDPNYAYRTNTTPIYDGRAKTMFNNIPMGEYAICAIHDWDMEGDFDRNWMFLPGEGWGTSNDVGGYFGPGNYKDSKFLLNSSEGTIYINIHY